MLLIFFFGPHRCPYNQEAVERALIGRLQPVAALPDPYFINRPEISASSQPFPDSKEEVQSRLAGADCKLTAASGGEEVPHSRRGHSLNPSSWAVSNVHK